MSHFASLPFPLGKTWDNTTITNSDNVQAGREYWIPDVDATNQPKIRSNRLRKVRVVRNSTGAVVLPKRLVKIKAGTYGQEVDRYSSVHAAENVFPSDEYLPSAGAPVDSLFYVVVEGPALINTNGAADATNVIAVGDSVVASTGNGTTNATMAGRIAVADFSGATAPLANNIRNTIGRALSAATTAQTNQDILIDVHPQY